MRFLADENFSAKLASWLRSLGHDVGSAAKAAPDPAVVNLAKAESRIILTHDGDFANENLYPSSAHAGVMLVRINPLHADKIRSAIARTLSQVPESGWAGRVFFIFEDLSVEWKEGRFLSPP